MTEQDYAVMGIDAATILLVWTWGFGTVLSSWAIGFGMDVAIKMINKV